MNLVHRGYCYSLVAILALLVAGCGEDAVSGDEDCPDGQTYNPIDGVCVVPGQGDGSGKDDNPFGTNGDSGDNTDDGENGTDDGTNDGGNDGNGGSGGNDGSNGGGPDVDECGYGEILGQSCRPDGAPLAGAEVTLSGEHCEDGSSFEMTTQADGDGYYEFDEVPAGNHHLTIESGSFSNVQPVGVQKDETTDLTTQTGKICVDGGDVSIAVLGGTYDDVGSLLEGMDVDYDVVGSDMGGGFDDLFGGDGDEDAEEFLSDLDEMLSYDILFIECGTLWDELSGGSAFGGGSDMTEIRANIRSYVEAGNSLYASDWAQPFIQEALPETVDFYNENLGTDGPREGATQTVDADVISSDMQGLLSSNTTEIDLSSPGWAVARDGGDGATVHFQADVQLQDGGQLNDSALMVTHEETAGAAIFTAFHNSAQATGEMEEILEFMIFQL